MAEPSGSDDRTNAHGLTSEECTCNGRLTTQFDGPEGRGSGGASKSQSRRARGVCSRAWRRLRSNRLLVVALVIIWALLAVFITLFIVSPREQRTPSESLLQCDFLPVTTLQCNGSSAINGSDSSTITSNTSKIMCSPDFYLDMDDYACKAECGKWKLYSDKLETAMVTLIILATAVGIIGGAVVLILSYLNYKKAFAFPSAFVRYQVAAVMVYNAVILISLIGGRRLFCSSRNLFAMKSTQYCTFTAVVFYYTYIQLDILWILHIGAIFWGLMFPFQAHRFDVTGKYKYLHLAAVLLAIFIPGINVAVALGPEGVKFPRIPPIVCGANSRNGNFYGLFLPITVVDAIGCSLLVLIFWMIHKNSQIADAQIQHVRTPEMKIVFINCYFLGFGIYALVIICASFWQTVAEQDLSEYLLCESIGRRPGISCPDERTYAVVLQFLFDIAAIVLGSFPAVNLIYAVNISDLKRMCKCHFPSWFARTPESSIAQTVLW